MAVSAPCDFICFKRSVKPPHGLQILLVECKKTIKDSYYFKSDRERLQFEILKSLSRELGIPCKYYIKVKGKLHIIDVENMPKVVK